MVVVSYRQAVHTTSALLNAYTDANGHDDADEDDDDGKEGHYDDSGGGGDDNEKEEEGEKVMVRRWCWYSRADGPSVRKKESKFTKVWTKNKFQVHILQIPNYG